MSNTRGNKMKKHFEITTRGIKIPVDDLLFNDEEDVAIYVKGLNKLKSYSKAIEILEYLLGELKKYEK